MSGIRVPPPLDPDAPRTTHFVIQSVIDNFLESKMHAHTSAKEREVRISEIEAEVAELQKELGLGEDAQQIVSSHIKLLHRYNEAKDATQIIIGKLAVHKQTTIRQTHEDYGLTDDD